MEVSKIKKSNLSKIFSVIIRSLGITLIAGYILALYIAQRETGRLILDVEIGLILGPPILVISISLIVSVIILMVIQKINLVLIIYEILVYLACVLCLLVC